MSSETESKLSELFAQLPSPDREVTERALARALSVLPTHPQRSETRVRMLAFLLAAAVALLVVAAGALAAVGALHVSFGQATHRSQRGAASSASQLMVPTGTRGVAATVGGRLWLTTASGLRLQGLPVTAAALSPHALYVAVGLGHSLVAMAPDGRRAWSHPTAGTVTAIAWAPDGLRIAYIVNIKGRFRLYAIEGNGNNNRLIDADVRATSPAWRSDSLALAYVAAGGHPVIYDFGHTSHTVIPTPAARGATFLAFAPSDDQHLAVATAHSVLVIGPVQARPAVFRDETIAGIGWINRDLAVATNAAAPKAGRAASVRLFHTATGDRLLEVGSLTAPARIAALDAWNSRLTLAVATQPGLRILSTVLPAAPPASALSQAELLLRLPAATRINSLSAR